MRAWAPEWGRLCLPPPGRKCQRPDVRHGGKMQASPRVRLANDAGDYPIASSRAYRSRPRAPHPTRFTFPGTPSTLAGNSADPYRLPPRALFNSVDPFPVPPEPSFGPESPLPVQPEHSFGPENPFPVQPERSFGPDNPFRLAGNRTFGAVRVINRSRYASTRSQNRLLRKNSHFSPLIRPIADPATFHPTP